MGVESAPHVTETSTAVSVIVPTYREAENLRLLAGRVFAALDAAGLAGELIIVDDDSRDGTREIAAELAQTRPVRLIVREGERGLSGAVMRGFAEARHDLFVVMDADLSHPPEQLAAIIEPARSGAADFVFGSRYIEGGRTRDWGVLRRLNSWVATLLARPLTSVRDPMAGYFCLHRRTWEDADALNPVGYKIGLELLVKGRCRRVVEIPIEFSDRLHGRSKLTLKQQWLYLVHLARLYCYRWPALTWLTPLLLLLIAGALVITLLE
jgi:dolichol-phosphate mannosyltransferase